ncbi:MAG TPA: DUF3618 domain-containing protein [Dermatophilaceae bacterium]|nr:DUF3618 domain-containing protein [Dermatophilaceae bacterium]
MTEDSKSVDELESDIATTRTHLAGTIDELTTRAQPKEIARRQLASTKASLDRATRTEDGDLRVERLAAVAAAVLAVVAAVVLLARRNRD